MTRPLPAGRAGLIRTPGFIKLTQGVVEHSLSGPPDSGSRAHSLTGFRRSG